MANYFSDKVSQLLEISRNEATRLYSRTIGPEHLLLAILLDNNNKASNILNRLNADIEEIKSELEEKARKDGRFEAVGTSGPEIGRAHV